MVRRLNDAQRGHGAILITGAASGLGARIAKKAAERGYAVHLVDVAPAVLEVARSLKGEGLIADLETPEACEAILSWAPDIDILVNNAGVGWKTPFKDMDIDQLEKTLNINVGGPVRLCRAYLERFSARGFGTVVNVSSSVIYFPSPGMALYGASKAFLSSFSESLIAESMDQPSICIIGVRPSGMNTGFQTKAGVRNERPDRLLDPDDVAIWIMKLIKRQRSGMFDYGLSTHLFNAMRRVLPGALYLRIVEKAFTSYR